jgi:hypothetical protein
VARKPSWQRFVAVALLAPLIALAASIARDLMVCRYSGEVVTACACPVGPNDTSAVASESCCERRSVERMPDAQAADDSPPLAPPVAPSVVLVVLPPFPHPRALASERPRAIGPPLLSKTVLLI